MREWLRERWDDVRFSKVVYRTKHFFFAVKWGWVEFLGVLFPNWYWRRKANAEFPVITFPENVVFQEVEDDGFIGLECVNPGSYGLMVFYPKDSHEPRRRAFCEVLELLAEFGYTDHLKYGGEVNIKFIFDENLTQKDEAVIVVPSEELNDSREAGKENPEMVI